MSLKTVETRLVSIDLNARKAYFDIISTIVTTRTVTQTRTISSIYKVRSVIVTEVLSIYTLDSPIRTAITSRIPTSYVKTVESILSTVITVGPGARAQAGGGGIGAEKVTGTEAGIPVLA